MKMAIKIIVHTVQGYPLPITSVVDVSDSFISITLSNRIVLIDVARKDVIIV